MIGFLRLETSAKPDADELDAEEKRKAYREEIVASRVAPPVWAFMHDSEGDTAAVLDRMVKAGQISDKDKHRVQIWRWLTASEAEAYGIDVTRTDRPRSGPPRLPAPPELKLLPAPVQDHEPGGAQDRSSVAKKDEMGGSSPQKPDDPPPDQPLPAKRQLTEDQLKRWLAAKDRPFGKPIVYPKRGYWP